MIKVASLIFIITLFSACSFKKPKNEWQHSSTNSFSVYSENFLKDNNLIAQNSLKRSISYAKKSADLETLSKIYLGECALKISVGLEDKCQKYLNIKSLVKSVELDAYYNFLSLNVKEEEIRLLPEQYKEFAEYVVKNDFNKASEAILEIEKISSKLIAAALIKDKLTNVVREKVLYEASFYGYKKAVLFWLEELKRYTTDTDEILKIEKKLNILRTKE
ncbi:hypothetical protein GJV85_05160 [Sulfurimonas aquatica]|uniref:Lipoprotein n=1 Tax=Sulfurimonas aquatica TaxID=2672570 RepID=A0A975AZR0_9BACT|nr:hypothetical protein [Sulfurimonas aquatica]QSZ41518.1 hypothetical protein GJV85_05160 [Sulfurimonas aquatica]